MRLPPHAPNMLLFVVAATGTTYPKISKRTTFDNNPQHLRPKTNLSPYVIFCWYLQNTIEYDIRDDQYCIRLMRLPPSLLVPITHSPHAPNMLLFDLAFALSLLLDSGRPFIGIGIDISDECNPTRNRPNQEPTNFFVINWSIANILILKNTYNDLQISIINRSSL